jgi:membrane peptidoglycan carboxypeptidase
LYGIYFIESRFKSEQDLLTLYLNTCLYGKNNNLNIRGIKAASREYFNKNPQNLSIAEISVLAAIPKDHELYSPIIATGNSEDELSWKVRGNTILKSMYENDYINKEEYTQAIDQLGNMQIKTLYLSTTFKLNDRIIFYTKNLSQQEAFQVIDNLILDEQQNQELKDRYMSLGKTDS